MVPWSNGFIVPWHLAITVQFRFLAAATYTLVKFLIARGDNFVFLPQPNEKQLNIKCVQFPRTAATKNNFAASQ